MSTRSLENKLSIYYDLLNHFCPNASIWLQFLTLQKDIPGLGILSKNVKRLSTKTLYVWILIIEKINFISIVKIIIACQLNFSQIS